MFNKKLTILLRSFSRPELRQLEKFLASGLQICPSNGGKLVSLLIRHYPDFDEKMPDKTWFYKQLFPGKTYNDSKLRLLVSDTYAAVRRFAVTELLDSAPENEAILFTQYLQTRGMSELLETEIGRAEKVLQQRARYNNLHHVHQWMLHHTENALLCERYFQNGKQKEHEAALEKAVHSLHYLYLTARIDYHLWRNENLTEKMPAELDQLYNHICALLPEVPETLGVMHKLMYLGDHMTDKTVLDEMILYFHSPAVEVFEYIVIRNLFSLLHNCALSMEWAGHPEYQFEKHRMFKRTTELDMVLTESQEAVSMVCNVARTSSAFKEYDFFETFYRKYEKHLPAAMRSSTYHFCMAMLNDSMGNYAEAFQHLQKITFESYRRRLLYKNLMMLLYYERGDYEALFSLADSARHFLKGAAMLRESERDYNNRFLNNLGRLVKLRVTPDEEQLQKLKTHLKENPAANWRWMVGKIDLILAELK